MTHRPATVLAVSIWLAGSGIAGADYDSHPDLRPGVRCQGIGADSPDCQKLIWDIAPALTLGQEVVAAPDPLTAYSQGPTDRPPPLYVGDTDGDMIVDQGFEEPGEGRERLCEDPDTVPWWEPTGTYQEVDGESYEVFRVACRRGTRIHYGPWQTGTDPHSYDKLVRAIVRFENSARLTRDGRPDDDRREWNTGVEFYNHIGSHHGTCRNAAAPYDEGCNNPEDPARASSEECREIYQSRYEECPMTDPVEECEAYRDYAVQARAATQFSGRFGFEYPDGRALVTLEDQLWTCNHHVVTQLFLDGEERNFRRQEGGTVGEMVIQHFTEDFANPGIEPLSFLGVGLLPILTTFVPPYTMSASSGVWYAPYDLQVALLAIHAHKRLVKGWVDAIPANPPRPASSDPDCGGWENGPAQNLYVTWHWDDGEPCDYWKEPNGPVTLRKGQGLRWHCTVNNGVTPDALEQHLGSGGAAQGAAPDALRDTLSTLFGTAEPVNDLLIESLENDGPMREALWGRQPPERYRVRYGCETQENVPPGTPPVFPARVCDPNPAMDAEGRPVDGPYENPDQCPDGTGRCVPANVVFANVAEDEMCLLFGLYWPLDRPVDADLNAAREGNLEDVLIVRPDDVMSRLDDPESAQEIGTPGALFKQIDDGGVCNGCSKTGIDRIDQAPSDESNVTRYP